MKPGVTTVAVLSIVAAGAVAVLAQDPWSTMLAGFDITVARTAQGVSLTCDNGCAWKTLAFSLGAKPTRVNEYGMVDDETKNPEKSGHFLMRVGTDKEGFTLSCDRGCAWRTLGWTFPAKGAAVRISEYGIAKTQ